MSNPFHRGDKVIERFGKGGKPPWTVLAVHDGDVWVDAGGGRKYTYPSSELVSYVDPNVEKLMQLLLQQYRSISCNVRDVAEYLVEHGVRVQS